MLLLMTVKVSECHETSKCPNMTLRSYFRANTLFLFRFRSLIAVQDGSPDIIGLLVVKILTRPTEEEVQVPECLLDHNLEALRGFYKKVVSSISWTELTGVSEVLLFLWFSVDVPFRKRRVAISLLRAGMEMARLYSIPYVLSLCSNCRSKKVTRVMGFSKIADIPLQHKKTQKEILEEAEEEVEEEGESEGEDEVEEPHRNRLWDSRGRQKVYLMARDLRQTSRPSVEGKRRRSSRSNQ